LLGFGVERTEGLCAERSFSIFQTSCRQAILLYGIPEENELDENKAIYNSQLVRIDDIPSEVVHEDTTVLDEAQQVRRGRPRLADRVRPWGEGSYYVHSLHGEGPWGRDAMQDFRLGVYEVFIFLPALTLSHILSAVCLDRRPIVTDSNHSVRHTPRPRVEPTHPYVQFFHDVLGLSLGDASQQRFGKSFLI